MAYKWSTETFRKTETLSTGEAHDYSGERYWIDIIATSYIHMDAVLVKVSKDNEAPIVTGKLHVNGMVVKQWTAPTIQEAAEYGENIIKDMQSTMGSIT